jgi:hypothetical protein
MNMLDLIRWGTDFQFGDTHRIVHHLLSPPDRQTTPNPFNDAAIPVLTSIVVHGHDIGQSSFPGVVQWMVEPTRSLKDKVEELLHSTNPLVTSGARRLADMSERLRASVWNACLTPLAIFEDPTIASHTRHSDVNFTSLLEGLQPVSLFLCPSFADVRRLSGFLGAFVEALIAVLGSPAHAPRHKVLLVLDEQANLGYLPELEAAVSYLQGSGTQILSAFQNIAQVHKTYGLETPLLASFATQVHFRPNDQATAEHVAGLLGETTVMRRSASAEVTPLGTWKSTRTESESERSLMTVDEILRLPQTAALVLQAGCAPVLARKQGTRPPTTGEKVTTLVSEHRQGAAIAACVGLVLLGTVPALKPLWTSTTTVVAERATLPVKTASLFPWSTPPDTPPVPLSESPPNTTDTAQGLPWKLWYHNTSGPAWTVPGVHAPKKTLRESFATGDECFEELDRQYGAQYRHWEKMAKTGNQGIGKLLREPGKLHWELGFPGRTNVFEAWCAQAE